MPKSKVPGEVSWPTQPFPTRPPPYAQQRFTAEEATDVTPEARAAVLKRLSEMVTGDIFIPPGPKSSVTLPQFNGGSEWGGAAFDPESNVLYVNASNEAEWISMVPSRLKKEVTPYELGRHLYRAICSTCHGFGNPQFPASPSLQSLKSVRERRSREDVLKLLQSGINQMPAFDSLSLTERKGLVAFLFEDRGGAKVSVDELELNWANEIPYVATGHHDWRDPEGFPVNKRPWGTLTAIDLNQGEFLWQSPLGTYPKLEARGEPPTGTFNIGGPLVTAGGLVFIGATMDERFHAFDKHTGKVLWEYQMDAGGYATPACYEYKGRQYVIIAAGGGGKPGTQSGNAYYAFALPD